MLQVDTQNRQGFRRRALERLFLCELWLNARLLPLMLTGRDLSGVMRLADSGTLLRYEGLSAETISAAVLKVTRRPWLMRRRRCFRQGILGFRFLKSAGYSPQLHFSVAAGDGPTDALSAHCWVVLGGVPVIDQNLEGMTPIHVHPSDDSRPA